MSELKEVLIADYIDLISGFAFKSSDFLEYQDSTSLPVIKIKNVANGDVNLDSVVYHKYDATLSKYVLYSGNVLIAMTGNHPHALTQVVGDVSRYKLNTNSLLNQRVGKIIAKENADIGFIYYLFKDKEVKNYLANKSSGSANQANISKADILNLRLYIPELNEQKAIAGMLSSFDEKIDLLHRQNNTLEAMAETLFRHWFVEEARDDWEIGTIRQLIYMQNGFAFKSYDFKDDGTNGVIKIKNISGGIIDIGNTDFIENSIIQGIDNRFKISTGDILVAMTGAEIGKLGIIPNTDKSLWLNQRVGLLKEKFKGARYLAYLQLKSEFGQDHIENTATGSAQPNISSTGIEDCGFPVLESSFIKKCALQIDELYTKVIFNLGQIRILEKFRDTLLPKLINCEVRIKG